MFKKIYIQSVSQTSKVLLLKVNKNIFSPLQDAICIFIAILKYFIEIESLMLRELRFTIDVTKYNII